MKATTIAFKSLLLFGAMVSEKSKMKIRFGMAVIVLIMSFSATSGTQWDFSPCGLLTPVSTENVVPSQLHRLFRNVMNVCRNGDDQDVFLYVTEYIKSNYIESDMSKKKYADMICRYFMRTNGMLNDQPENGDHSIIMEEGRRSACGHPQSYWMVHTGDEKKELVFRIKLAYEEGVLRINDH